MGNILKCTQGINRQMILPHADKILKYFLYDSNIWFYDCPVFQSNKEFKELKQIRLC